MTENYKHLYEQTKKMLTMYQDELIPGFRKQIEELEAKSKWIPVTERLPDDDTDVLAYMQDSIEARIFPANYAQKVWFDCIFNIRQLAVTHWMPLPDPPQEVDNG